MQQTVHFEAHVREASGRLCVNDEDVTDKIEGFSVQCRQGEPSLLMLWTKPEIGVIAGEAFVHQYTTGADWQTVLDTIDPVWLQQTALEREEFGGKTMVENILDVIKERFHAAAQS